MPLPKPEDGIAAGSIEHRLLLAAHRLRHFSETELAAASEVVLEAIRAWLTEGRWVEPQPARDDQDNSSPWRLKPQCQAEVLSIISRLAQPVARSGLAPKSGFDEWALLEHTLEYIEGSHPTGADLQRELAHAQLYLRGIERVHKRRKAQLEAQHADVERRIAAYTHRLSTQLPRSELSERIPMLDQFALGLRQALADWHVDLHARLENTVADPPLRLPHAAPLADQGSAILRGFRALEADPRRFVFIPACRALALRRAAAAAAVESGAGRANSPTQSWTAIRQAAIDACREAIRIDPAPDTLAAAALLAVVLDAVELSDTLFQALLAGTWVPDPAGLRRLYLQSLAHLARTAAASEKTTGSETANAPAAACLYLISRNRNREELPILAPAALCLGTEGSFVVLDDVASTLFDSTELREEFRPIVDVGALMRNIATALFLRRGHIGIGRHFNLMLGQDHARGFVDAFLNARHGAVWLWDGNHADYTLLPPDPRPAILKDANAIIIEVIANSAEHAVLQRALQKESESRSARQVKGSTCISDLLSQTKRIQQIFAMPWPAAA